MVPNSQRALAFQHNSLQIVDRQVLSPGSGELLVKILSGMCIHYQDQVITIYLEFYVAALNPIDSYFALGSFSANGVIPSVLGCDAAGVVEAVGAEVSNFEEGDQV
jgi:Zn-dependent alcohol dehydrogenase